MTIPKEKQIEKHLDDIEDDDEEDDVCIHGIPFSEDCEDCDDEPDDIFVIDD